MLKTVIPAIRESLGSGVVLVPATRGSGSLGPGVANFVANSPYISRGNRVALTCPIHERSALQGFDRTPSSPLCYARSAYSALQRREKPDGERTACATSKMRLYAHTSRKLLNPASRLVSIRLTCRSTLAHKSNCTVHTSLAWVSAAGSVSVECQQTRANSTLELDPGCECRSGGHRLPVLSGLWRWHWDQRRIGTFGDLGTAEMVKESRFEVNSFTASGAGLAGATSLARANSQMK